MNFRLNRFILLFIILNIIHHSLSVSSNKLPECTKNSTNLGYYKPYFKSSKICVKNLVHVLRPFGLKFYFDCNFDSNPPGTVVWFKKNETTNKFDMIKNLINHTELSIPNISLNDDGHYICSIFNDLGTISHSFKLTVSDTPLAPPTFNHREELLTVAKGDRVSLDCTYKTYEYTTLMFYKANDRNNYTFEQLISMNDNLSRANYLLELINSTETFNQFNLSSPLLYSLIIENLSDDDFGVYMCVASNRYGKSLKFIKLSRKRLEFNFFILLYMISCFIFVMIFLLIFQAYLRSRDKKKLMIEKSYIIRKKIVIDCINTKHNLINSNGNQVTSVHNSTSEFELNSYQNFPVFPRVEIIKERKEIIGKKLHDELKNKEEFFEIDLDPEWEIDRNCLKLDEIIGHGNFGVVQRAFLITNAFSNNYYDLQNLVQFGDYGRIDLLKFNDYNQSERQGRVVAVKKLKEDYNDNDVKNFISEMVIMKLYGNHKNIINLIGTCTQDGPFCVIMEYAEKGNLKDFLKNYRINNCYIPSSVSQERLSTRDLISFALQIAHGMHHLASLHCIHRDLAARNILVTGNLQMKISDFGLSRNTGDSEYYRKSSDSFVPIKWLAPECISHQLYTVQTDVWSYAVTLWELTSLGNSPYENLDPQDMFFYLKAGERMSKPQWCNEDMYNLMLKCWDWDPKHRPLFDKIIQYLQLLFEREVNDIYVY